MTVLLVGRSVCPGVRVCGCVGAGACAGVGCVRGCGVCVCAGGGGWVKGAPIHPKTEREADRPALP